MEEPKWIKADDITKEIAKRLRDIRREKKISQEQLWYISGVSLGSIKRFERSGNISLTSLVKIAFALGELEYLKNLFVKSSSTL